MPLRPVLARVFTEPERVRMLSYFGAALELEGDVLHAAAGRHLQRPAGGGHVSLGAGHDVVDTAVRHLDGKGAVLAALAAEAAFLAKRPDLGTRSGPTIEGEDETHDRRPLRAQVGYGLGLRGCSGVAARRLGRRDGKPHPLFIGSSPGGRWRGK